MSGNTFGTLFTVTNFGESHGPAIGCVIDGCPPGMALSEADIQHDLDRRRPGTSRHVTQRNEPDAVEILSGVYQGKTTGTPIALLIRNQDQRSKDYGDIAERFRPGHADYIVFDRRHLGYLNFIEKFHCTYCEYGNGLMSYMAEILARTEEYFCPIKHAHKILGTHARYNRFLEYGDAADYEAKLEEYRVALGKLK